MITGPPGQVGKRNLGRGLHPTVIKKRLRVRIPGCVLLGNEDSEAVYLLIS